MIEEAVISKSQGGPNRSVTTLTTWIIAMVAVVVGLALLATASYWDWVSKKPGLQGLINNIAGTIIASVALVVLWELFGKRSFRREILETAKYASDMDLAGVSHVGTNYLKEPDWDDFFKGVDRLDIFFAYGSTWRNSNRDNLESLAKRSGTRIRVFLPDPADDYTMQVLSKRFSYEPERLAALVNEAKVDFASLPVSGTSSVEVYFRKGDSLFSCYRFGSLAVLTLYSHQKKRTGVPTVVCQSGGSLYDFFVQEFDAICEQSDRVYPKDLGVNGSDGK